IFACLIKPVGEDNLWTTLKSKLNKWRELDDSFRGAGHMSSVCVCVCAREREREREREQM
ncbi:hypothetical protein D1N63_19810, partial [Clostridioides difficile]